MTHLILIVVFTMLGFVLHGMKQMGGVQVPTWAPWASWAIGVFLVSVFKQMGQICRQLRRVFCSSFSCYAAYR